LFLSHFIKALVLQVVVLIRTVCIHVSNKQLL
jgi:hypothetical protein